MKHRSSVTYSTFYTDAYRDRRVFSEWITNSRSAGVRKRLWQSKHLLKIAKTQTLGRRIDDDLLQAVTKINQLASLDARLRLRKLQHKILEHLYRPTGVLARRFATTIVEASVGRPLHHPDAKTCAGSHASTLVERAARVGIPCIEPHQPQCC